MKGRGALKRREPTGASAKGIPSHCSIPDVFATPLNVPEVVLTSRLADAPEAPDGRNEAAETRASRDPVNIMAI